VRRANTCNAADTVPDRGFLVAALTELEFDKQSCPANTWNVLAEELLGFVYPIALYR